MGIAIFLWSLANYLFSGFVFMKVWNWFAVTALNVPALSWVSALGLLVVISFFKNVTIKSKAEQEFFKVDKEEKFANCVAGSVLIAWVLLIGFIVSLFV